MLQHQIGQAVEAARKRVGISLKEFADKTHLDVVLLTSIERGEVLVSTAKLDRIASVLGIDAFALYEGRDEERALVALPRYAARSDFQQEDLTVLRRAFERATNLFDVSSLLGKRSRIAEFSHHAPKAKPSDDGYNCARRVRKALGAITDPLGSLSSLLAEDFHIPVIAERLATGALQAVAVRSARNRAGAIVLNRNVKNGPPPGSMQSWLVDRVSVCHELCHILFDEPRGGIIDVVLDDIDEGRSVIEQRANAFAAELLIPLLGLESRFGQATQIDTPGRAEALVDNVRAHFKTPIEITVNHLYNHGFVARVDEFRRDLILSAQSRLIPELTALPANEDEIASQVFLARTREAHDACLIMDGAARALLHLELGAPLPWELDTP